MRKDLHYAHKTGPLVVLEQERIVHWEWNVVLVYAELYVGLIVLLWMPSSASFESEGKTNQDDYNRKTSPN